MVVTTINADPKGKGGQANGAKPLSGTKPAPDMAGSADGMKHVSHIVKALHGSMAAGQDGAAIGKMIAAAERRMESPIAVNVRACMALIDLCSKTDGEDRKRLLALAGKAYMQLPEKGKVLGRLGLPSPRQIIDADLKRALNTETAVLRDVCYTKTVGRVKEQLTIEESTIGNMAPMSHIPSGDGSRIAFLANVMEAIGKAKGDDARGDGETLDMLQKAVMASWELDDGASGHFNEETRFACVRALFENSETELRFWYLLLGDSSERIAGYATEKMLGIADQEGVEYSGWMLIRKKVGQCLGYGHVGGMDSVLRRVACSGSEDANRFIESLDAKMLGLLGDMVARKGVKIPLKTAECVSGMLDCEDKRETALKILRGAERLPDGRTMEIAKSGNITAVKTVATVEPRELGPLLRHLFESKADAVVDGKDAGRMAWVCAGEKLLYDLESGVRRTTAGFLFGTRKEAGWRITVENQGLEELDGRSREELLNWAVDGKRPATLRRIALRHALAKMGAVIPEKAYSKIAKEPGRGDATAATKLAAIKIISKTRKLGAEDVPAMMEIARKGRQAIALEAMIALQRCGVELPAGLVKSRYLSSKSGVRMRMTALLPDLAPSLGDDAKVMDRIKWSLPEDQINGAAAIARYANAGSRIAVDAADEILEYAKECAEMAGTSVEEFAVAATMAVVLYQNRIEPQAELELAGNAFKPAEDGAPGERAPSSGAGRESAPGAVLYNHWMGRNRILGGILAAMTKSAHQTALADKAEKVLWDYVIPEMTDILTEEKIAKKDAGRITRLTMMLMPEALKAARAVGRRQEDAKEFLDAANRRIFLEMVSAGAGEGAAQRAKAVSGRTGKKKMMLS